MTPGARLAVLAGLATVLLALTGIGSWALWHWRHDVVVWIMLVETPLYAAAAWFLWRHEESMTAAWRRKAMLAILGVAVLSRVLLIAAPPLSTDIYRYVWDGRVQAAGINPYRYRPADPQVAFLRDQAIFPRINRADSAVTIYPPAAQLIFAGVTRVGASVTAMKMAMVGFEVLSMAVLLSLLRSRGLPETRIIFYAWHPLPLFEFAGSGHIDAAALALMLLACWSADRRQPSIAGVILGAAALVKFFPLAIAPTLYRRWDWKLPAAMLAAAAVLYLPYVKVGWQVVGFLPDYVREEALAAGSGFFLLNALSTVMPLASWAVPAYIAAALLILAAIGLGVILRREGAAVPIASALLLLTAFTLIVSPHFAWYFVWIVPLLCFRPSWALIYLTGAAPLLYAIIWSPNSLLLHAALYLPCASIFAIERARLLRGAKSGVLNDGRLGPRGAG